MPARIRSSISKTPPKPTTVEVEWVESVALGRGLTRRPKQRTFEPAHVVKQYLAHGWCKQVVS